MENFVFYSPTEFVFGKKTEKETANYIQKYGGSKVLIHFGGGSVIKSGLLGDIESQLKSADIDYILLGGVQPNPRDTLVYEGIELCKKENIDFILAVGGGSVIDSAKAIAAGALYNGDFWDFYDGKLPIERALKIGTVVTLPAAGSEGSPNTVITKVSEGLKRGIKYPCLRPVFSIMNPELTFTLPPYQTACGITDMFAHIMERYFTNTENVELSDRLCEGSIKTILELGPVVMKEPENYDARANLMWAGMIAHNGSLGIGRTEDWASHALEHELSALYDCAHGAGLAVIIPAWMRYVSKSNPAKFEQFARRVFHITKYDTSADAAEMAIDKLEQFFISIGMPVTFKELGAKEEDIDELVRTLRINKGDIIGGYQKLTMEDAKNIYKLACK